MKKKFVNFRLLPLLLMTIMLFGSRSLSSETYSWNQNGSASYSTAANWTPNRTSPAVDDILVFDNGSTTTVTGITNQTVGGLLVSNNTKVTLNSSGIASTLTINNGISGNDFSVASGCEFNIAQTTNNSALIIAIATGAVGSVSGSMDFSSATASTPNQISSADASGLTFNSGAVFTQNTNNSGSVFGSGKANSVIFSSGSTFVQHAGSNPFQKTQPASVVEFQSGSLFKLKNNTGASFSGRTYANLEYDNSGAISPDGASSLSIDHLTITSGTFNFNMTADPGHSIKGNITVASGAALNFNPSSVGTINLNGSSTQTINGLGTLTIASNASFVVNSNVIIEKNISFGGALTINTSKSITVNASKQLTATGTLTNNGTITLRSMDGVGTATIITGTVTGSGTTVVEQFVSSAGTGTGGRNWYISSPLTAATSSTITTATGNGLVYYNGSGYSDAGTTMDVMKGYIAKSPAGDRTIQFTGGTLNTGSLSATNLPLGFNLVGNPYASYVDWNQATKANLNATMWYRSKEQGSYKFYTYNGTAAGYGGGVVGVPANVSNLIPPMQAFWVKAEGGVGSFGFTNSMRSHLVGTNPLKAPVEVKSIQKLLRLEVSNSLTTDETVLYFNPNASDTYDAFDSPKMLNGSTSTVPDIYTLVGTEQLVINGMKEMPYDVEIPLYFKPNASAANTYTLKANEISNFSLGTLIYIKNNSTGIKNIISDGSAYVFEPTNLGNPAFSLIIKAPESTTEVRNARLEQIRIYVNKNSQISVTTKNGIEEGTISVYNAVGQLLYSNTITQSTTLIGKSFTPGVYMVKVNVDGKTNSQKVILK